MRQTFKALTPARVLVPQDAMRAADMAFPSLAVPRVEPWRWWALAVVVAAQFMFVADAFIANVALPSIRTDLRASPAEIEAVIAGYQVAYAAMVITGGRLGDLFGRRRAFVTGVMAFTLASFWCGMAHSGTELVLARLAQGGMAALMVPQVLATIHTLFPDAGRSRAFAVFGIALGLGGAAGFALGGWLLTLNVWGLGWRSVFLVNLPVGAAISLAALRLMPETAARPGTQLDLRGAVLLFLALACLIGPMMAGRELGWAWWLWAVAAAGGLMLGSFLRLERAVEQAGGLPLVDLTLLVDRRFLRGLATVFSFQFGNASFYLVLTLFVQTELAFRPLQAGLVVVPMALAFMLASQLAGHWMRRGGISVLFAGSAVQFAGIVSLAGLALLVDRPGIATLMATLVTVRVWPGTGDGAAGRRGARDRAAGARRFRRRSVEHGPAGGRRDGDFPGGRGLFPGWHDRTARFRGGTRRAWPVGAGDVLFACPDARRG